MGCNVFASFTLFQTYVLYILLKFRRAFELFDKNGAGSIGKEELGKVMRDLGQYVRQEELDHILQEVVNNADGKIGFEDFVDIARNSNVRVEEVTGKDGELKELMDTFRVFDKHNKGYITASDLRAVMLCFGEDLSEKEIEDMFKEVDVSIDGRIDFYEFVKSLVEPSENGDFKDEDNNI